MNSGNKNYSATCAVCGRVIFVPSGASGNKVSCSHCNTLHDLRQLVLIEVLPIDAVAQHSRPAVATRIDSPLLSVSQSYENEKMRIYGALGIGTIIALIVVLTNLPQETGWWLFKTVSIPYQFLVGSAFLLSAGYIFLVVRWYSNAPISLNTTLLAFLLCGTVSIFLTLFLGPIIGSIGREVRLVESGAWIFKQAHEVAVYENGFLSWIHRTGVVAGIIEEPAKLIALLLIKPVRNMIVDRRSGLYYATLCAFGFALIENITYFQKYGDVMFIRANPAHAVFSSIWGVALGSWRQGNIGIGEFVKYLALGIALHGLWNYFSSLDLTLFIVTFGLTIWLGLSFIRRELSQSSHQTINAVRDI